MDIYDYLWLFMVIYCYLWLFIVIYGYLWLFMVIYGYLWLFMVIGSKGALENEDVPDKILKIFKQKESFD